MTEKIFYIILSLFLVLFILTSQTLATDFLANQGNTLSQNELDTPIESETQNTITVGATTPISGISTSTVEFEDSSELSITNMINIILIAVGIVLILLGIAIIIKIK